LEIAIGIPTFRIILSHKTSFQYPFMKIIKCAILPKSMAPVKRFDVLKSNST
jgi:hypothetical protein